MFLLYLGVSAGYFVTTQVNDNYTREPLTCSASFTNKYFLKDKEITVKGLFHLTNYEPGKIDVSVKGTLNSDGVDYILNRKLLYSFTKLSNNGSTSANVRLFADDKSPVDNAPDDLIDEVFVFFKKTGDIYFIKQINNNTFLIGDSYSPKYLCLRD